MAINRGRLINFISGINGVTAGGNGIVNLPVNRRMHRLKFQCTAVNYTGGAGQAITAITGSGTAATGTLTISNGVPTAITIVAGGSDWNVGDTFTIADATGTGFVGTVATVTGGPPGALATATVTVAGTPSAISPATFFSSMKLLVNGVNMRDISPADTIKIAQANGLFPDLGELPIYFTAPWRNVNQANEVGSWDLFGQATFSIQFSISGTVTSPGLVGIEEFDYARNLLPDGKPFLQPTAHHAFGFPVVIGRNDINTLPIDYPISRMWIYGSTPGQLSQIELFQDGNKPMEATLEQMKESYQDYGFQFGRVNYENANWASSAALQGAIEQPVYFDAAFISDPDQRWGKALSVDKSMILRLYSAVAQQVTVVMETLPGAFA